MIIAVYHSKGGVGKTATAVNLAYLAAQDGMPTLLWDVDAQGAACYYFRIKPKIKGGGETLFQRKKTVEDAIKGSDFENLDLLPADFSNRNLDVLLEQDSKAEKRFHKMLERLQKQYAYIFLDCPPGLSKVSEAVFESADMLLMPIIPTVLSVRALEQVQNFGKKHRLPPRVRPFLSMLDRRKQLHRDMAKTLPEQQPDLLNTAIPYASDIERMGVFRQPVGCFAKGKPVDKAYRNLWEEIKLSL